MSSKEWIEEVRPGRRLYLRKVSLFASTNGQRLSSLQFVFLHGLCSTELFFHPLLEELQRQLNEANEQRSPISKFDCFMFDFAGCGQSPRPTATASRSSPLSFYDMYTNEQSVLDIRLLIDKHLDRTVPVVFVTHSYATSILVPLLLQHRTSHLNVKACIFISSGVKTPALTAHGIVDGGHPLIRYGPLLVLNCLQSSMTEAFVAAAVHDDANDRKTIDDIRSRVRHQSNANDMKVVKGYHSNLQWASPTDLIESTLLGEDCIPLPILVVHGVHDQVIPIQAGQELYNLLSQRPQLASSTSKEAESRHAKLVIMERSSHFVLLEETQRLATEMLDFLAQL